MTPDTYIAATSLGDLLLQTACQHGDRPALIFPETSLTYRELADRAKLRARQLLTLGVKPGEHVGVLALNRAECIEILFGCALVGAVTVMLNARYRVDELGYVLGHADLRLLFTSAPTPRFNFPDLIDQAFNGHLSKATDPGDLKLEDCPTLRSVLLLGEGSAPGCLTAEATAALGDATDPSTLTERRLQIVLRDPCLMMYTSGTTSRPKGCLLSHEALVRNSEGMRERLRIKCNDVQWNPLPLFHMASIMPLLAMVHAGGCYVTDAHFDPAAALEQIRKHRATLLYPAFPAIMADLLAHPDFRTDTLNHVRLVNNVAPPEQLRANMRALPRALHISAFGMTEASGICCHGSADEDDETRVTTCGKPYTGVQLRVVDNESGAPLPRGERGEMQVRGFSLFNGYYRDPDTTVKAMAPGGWFRTGDLCSITDGGQVTYHGRLKDLLKIGGENVSPLEIENWLGTHPAIHMAQVVGAPDERLGEVAAAFIELRPGAALSAEELIEYCRGQIASFKIPRHVRFISEWPMSATKVQKNVLSDQLLKELSSA